jgi:hypothetical protein
MNLELVPFLAALLFALLMLFSKRFADTIALLLEHVSASQNLNYVTIDEATAKSLLGQQCGTLCVTVGFAHSEIHPVVLRALKRGTKVNIIWYAADTPYLKTLHHAGATIHFSEVEHPHDADGVVAFILDEQMSVSIVKRDKATEIQRSDDSGTARALLESFWTMFERKPRYQGEDLGEARRTLPERLLQLSEAKQSFKERYQKATSKFHKRFLLQGLFLMLICGLTAVCFQLLKNPVTFYLGAVALLAHASASFYLHERVIKTHLRFVRESVKLYNRQMN